MPQFSGLLTVYWPFENCKFHVCSMEDPEAGVIVTATLLIAVLDVLVMCKSKVLW